MAGDDAVDRAADEALRRTELEDRLLSLARSFEEGEFNPDAPDAVRRDISQSLLDARWALRTEAVDGSGGSALSAQDFSMQRENVRHKHRLENLQYLMAIGLVVALFVVLAIGLFKGESGDSVGQFAAPLSGLAGIAIGWLFRDSSSKRE